MSHDPLGSSSLSLSSSRHVAHVSFSLIFTYLPFYFNLSFPVLLPLLCPDGTLTCTPTSTTWTPWKITFATSAKGSNDATTSPTPSHLVWGARQISRGSRASRAPETNMCSSRKRESGLELSTTTSESVAKSFRLFANKRTTKTRSLKKTVALAAMKRKSAGLTTPDVFAGVVTSVVQPQLLAVR